MSIGHTSHCLLLCFRSLYFSDFSGANLRPSRGRWRWGDFCSGKSHQNPPRAFPPRYLPWGTRLSMRQAGVRPVTLAVAPVSATTPSHHGNWPYRWAVSTSGPTLEKRRSRRRGFCCTILLRCGKGRGLPGPLVPLYCPGGFGRGKPLPYTQQRKKFGNVQGLFAPGPRQLGTVAGQGKALGVEAGTNRGADITHRMQRHLCDPTRLRAEQRRLHTHPVPRGGFHKAGEGPAFGGSLVTFCPLRKSPCGANPGWQA